MGRTACTKPQCLNKGAFYLYFLSTMNDFNPYLANVQNMVSS